MKIKRIKNSEVDVGVGESVVIVGGHGSKRGEALRLIGEIWMRSLPGYKKREVRVSDDWEFTFEVGAEYEVIRVRVGEEFGGLKGLEGLVEMGEMGRKRYVGDGVLLYGWNSVQSGYGVSEHDGGLMGSIASVVQDLHTHQIRRSIVLVDDFDAYMTRDESEEVFRHLSGLLSTGGNQLVVGCCRNDFLMSDVCKMGIIGNERRSVISDILSLFIKNKKT